MENSTKICNALLDLFGHGNERWMDNATGVAWVQKKATDYPNITVVRTFGTNMIWNQTTVREEVYASVKRLFNN